MTFCNEPGDAALSTTVAQQDRLEDLIRTGCARCRSHPVVPHNWSSALRAGAGLKLVSAPCKHESAGWAVAEKEARGAARVCLSTSFY